MLTRVDVFLQYYLPHVSGLTNTAVDVNEYLARNQGFDVHVHCSRKAGESRYEWANGVHVHRYRTWAKIGRASISPGLLLATMRMRKLPGIAIMHLPYPEAGTISTLLGQRWRKILVYHCDAGRTTFRERIVAKLLDLSHRGAIRRADTVVVTSEDYANNSRLSEDFGRAHTIEIPVPSRKRGRGEGSFRIHGKRLIGFLGRPTSEKGLDVLIGALRFLPDEYELLIAGPTSGLVEANAFEKSLDNPLLAGRIHHIGMLAEEQIADFYASLDIFALPSTNSFEAFGIVQVEAIAAGVPVVVSNLPGVRTISQVTGFGAVAEIGNSRDFALKILQLREAKLDEVKAQRRIADRYLNPAPLEKYAQEVRRIALMSYGVS